MISVNPQPDDLPSAEPPSAQVSASKSQPVLDTDLDTDSGIDSDRLQGDNPLPFSRLERILFSVLEFLTSIFQIRLGRVGAWPMRANIFSVVRPGPFPGQGMPGTLLKAGVRDWYCKVTGRC
ncbi:MAG: hypothetical protein AAF152_07045 [Cyanobacteria bacterium P01_A01_bin.114]